MPRNLTDQFSRRWTEDVPPSTEEAARAFSELVGILAGKSPSEARALAKVAILRSYAQDRGISLAALFRRLRGEAS